MSTVRCIAVVPRHILANELGANLPAPARQQDSLHGGWTGILGYGWLTTQQT